MNRRAALIFFLFAVWAPAQIVPGMFIVEMEEPGKTGRQAAATKQSVRMAAEQRGARILDSFERVMDALVVQVDDAQAPALAAMPGVRKVYPVMEGHLEMDGALPLHRVYDAWSRIGGIERAGAGIRIGIIDTGIEQNHPGFSGAGMVAPEGFPKGNRETDLSGTNAKIIVARSYENLVSAFNDPTPGDTIGHGTAVAMVAAGARHKAPFAEIAGMAPRAYLGNYKVFASNGSTRSDIVIRAMEDAAADGMNILNISLGFTPAPRAIDDPVVRAVERLAEAGVIVVKSMGNDGPQPNTGSSPSSAASIVTVGAMFNSRALISTVTVGDAPAYLAVPSDAQTPSEALQAPLADVEPLDANGLACNALPDGSLNGKIALIQRGECFFEMKLNNAQRAGALGAIVYTDDRDVVVMGVGSATLPAMMILRGDGLRIKEQIAANSGVAATMRFEGAPFPLPGAHIASFSSRGPLEDGRIAPDLMAAGVEVYTATQTANARGEIYDPRGYAIVDGTSFSSPMGAGALAVVMGARPGLTMRQYRSLLINSASRFPAEGNPEGNSAVQSTGAGVLNVDAAVRANAAAFPASVTFGADGSTVDRSRDLEITNVGTETDTFTLTALPHEGSPAPELAINSFTLAPKAARTIALRWNQAGLAPGEYQGVLVVRGTLTDAELRIPYWYAVTSAAPRFISLFNVPASAFANSSVVIYSRSADAAGVILPDAAPEVVAESGDGFVTGTRSVDEVYPGYWRIQLRLGPFPGQNVFVIKSGEAQRRVTIRGN